MKKQLKAIFDQPGCAKVEDEFTMKNELVFEASSTNSNSDVFYTSNCGQYKRGNRGQLRRNQANRGQFRNYQNSRGYFKNNERNGQTLRSLEVNQNCRDSNEVKPKLRKNPPDASGNTSRCLICDSMFHWARDCPYRSETHDELPKLQLLSEEIHDCYIEQFAGESLNSLILDSGCSKIVCGRNWLNCFKESLNNEDLNSVKEFDSKSKFKFGDGKVVDAQFTAIILAYITNKRIEIKSRCCGLLTSSFT